MWCKSSRSFCRHSLYKAMSTSLEFDWPRIYIVVTIKQTCQDQFFLCTQHQSGRYCHHNKVWIMTSMWAELPMSEWSYHNLRCHFIVTPGSLITPIMTWRANSVVRMDCNGICRPYINAVLVVTSPLIICWYWTSLGATGCPNIYITRFHESRDIIIYLGNGSFTRYGYLYVLFVQLWC